MSLDDSMTDLEDDGQRLFARVNASKLPFHVESIIVSFILIVPLDRQKEVGSKMDMKLELVPIPVSDVDRAKAFYVEKVGFHLDHDVQPGNGMRIVQLTPPGSVSFDLIRFVFPSYKFSRLLAIGRLVEPMKVMSRLDGPAA